MSTTLAPGIAAPRIPKDSPVSAIIVRTDARQGNSRALALVSDHRGYLVEVLSAEGGEDVEALLYARWPWFSTYQRGRFGLDEQGGGGQAWPTSIYVAPGEYRRLRGLEPFGDRAEKLRALGDRCQRFAAIRQRVNDVSTHGASEMPAVVYMRDAEHAGDHVSLAVRRAFARLERLGMVERVDETDGRTFRQYRPTATTPAYR